MREEKGNSQAPSEIHRVDRVRPLVAIVGRPNVGKSTLFNRVLKRRWAITDDRPGVTRDRIYAEGDWDGRQFTLIDTGGYIPQAKDDIEEAVRIQAEMAIEEADILVLVCDATTGVTDIDKTVAEQLRKAQQPCLLVVNKIDTPKQDRELDPFFALGLGDPVPVSAATGRQSGDFLESLICLFEGGNFPSKEAEDQAIRVVLAGRPNVGKSTLINRLAGYQVSIVHDQPGTTRDTTNIRLAWEGQEFLLMDTAGLRRRSKVEDPVEYYSGRRATASIERADVVVVLIDAIENCTVQDVRIINQAIESGSGLLIVVNKWDLVERGEEASSKFVDDLHHRFPFLVDYPILFISALTGRRVQKCLGGVVRVSRNRRVRIPTARLNAFLGGVTKGNPPVGGGRELRLIYATQNGVAPPTFVFFANHPELINSAYRRFIEKRLRDEFNFEGAPIRTLWRKRRNS